MALQPPLSFNDVRDICTGAHHDGTSEALLERLSARAGIPELDTFELPDDWRADQARDPKQCCTTCHWNGRWDQILELPASRTVGHEYGCIPRALQKSASDGNLCCAIFFALSRKFDVERDESKWLKWVGDHINPRWHNPPWSNFYGSERVRLKDVYISCCGSTSQAPPGATAYPDGGHKSIDPRSEESLAWAKRHIEECVNSHNCHAFQSKKTRLPTRLVYIPKDPETTGVQLIQDPESLPKDTRYAALSHCWGNLTPPCLTTTKNIDKYATDGIPWARIPQTFRHAMLYARKLDLDFIWIDSMCIIQGADGDWRSESTQMFQYYSNAYVTLASSFSSDCNGGFFSEKHINASRLYLLDVKFRGQRYPVFADHFHLPEGYLYDIFKKGNDLKHLRASFRILHRAWIYQERLVSPRLLFFSEQQLIFECFGGRWFQETGKATSTVHKQKYGDSLSNTAREKAEIMWLTLLSEYCALQITYAGDKLPAIAAIAEQFLSHQNLPHPPEHEYICGLRRSHLYIDLMWTARGDDNCWRGDSYLAPSWSWASVPRKTTYDCSDFPSDEPRSTVTLIREHLEFARGGRFGRVLGGYITIEGPACEILPFYGDSKNQDFLLDGCKFRLPGVQCEFKFWVDATNVQLRIGELVVDGTILKKLTLLQTYVSMDGASVGFVVLYRNSIKGRYRRVGAGSAGTIRTGGDWTGLKILFEKAERRELEIE
ncbi:heterokaryon incompatibility protein-domain-containing protein [Phyllosticta capitalensis]